MIQLVVNVNLLREIDERKFIFTYARLFYNNESDVTNDSCIYENLIKLLDWDVLGDNGLALYCGKFEKLKRKDVKFLISFIKDNSKKIQEIGIKYANRRKQEHIKKVMSYSEKKLQHYLDENYSVSGRGKKAVPCEYKGRHYKSVNECRLKEGISYKHLYQYLKETGQK